MPRPFFGMLLADVLPQVAEHRHLAARDVVGDRDARQLDDAALDGVHQREVAHRPGEQRALGVAGAAQEERRGRQVVDDAATPSLRLTASRPEIHSRAASLFSLASSFSSPFRSLRSPRVLGLLAVAVVRLVVEDDDVLHAHQLGHDALEHLAFGFQRVELLAARLASSARPPWRQLDPLAAA